MAQVSGGTSEALAVMRLRPDAELSSCRRWIVGIPLASGEDDVDAVARLLARDPEANTLSEADVRWETFSIGVYERQCVTVRGVLGRTIRTVTIPSGADAQGHHH